MRGAGGSTAARESSVSAVAERAADERVVDEHRRYVPGEPLRRYVAGYTGYRQRGLPPARDRLERAPPDQPVPRRDRPDAEGRRPGHQVRPGQEAAGPQPRRRHSGRPRPARPLQARRPGRRLRLLRPGSPGPGVPRAGRLPAEPVAGRGVPKRPSRELGDRGRLGVNQRPGEPAGADQPKGRAPEGLASPGGAGRPRGVTCGVCVPGM